MNPFEALSPPGADLLALGGSLLAGVLASALLALMVSPAGLVPWAVLELGLMMMGDKVDAAP